MESKVYIEIVKQLRMLISKEKLKPGDKLPSERELSERLNVGRSSVREALRALELLGLIETRRGEGTFIRDFRGNQLVQLLSTFILQDEKAINDVIETKHCIELDCLNLALVRGKDSAISDLKKTISSHSNSDESFFYHVAQLADNHLLLRVWLILNDYYKALELKPVEISMGLYEELIAALESRDEQKVLSKYRNLRNLSTNS
ncbi:FadR/GntR family transcriptional regulator [Bacillus sp. CGMCC 1.16607]|uniref:FadR/GntR family transcriptional regulator n=1 Tax=Bacillus sp. CGMCC 1.16607 TaxID=3351842 RepID=UPI00363EB60A